MMERFPYTEDVVGLIPTGATIDINNSSK